MPQYQEVIILYQVQYLRQNYQCKYIDTCSIILIASFTQSPESSAYSNRHNFQGELCKYLYCYCSVVLTIL